MNRRSDHQYLALRAQEARAYLDRMTREIQAQIEEIESDSRLVSSSRETGIPGPSGTSDNGDDGRNSSLAPRAA